MRERLVFEVGDDLLDDRVVAVLGLDDLDLVGAVGDECEVAPVGPQLGLRADQAGAAHDQPAAVVFGFGDLRLAFFGVVDALPGALPRFEGRFRLAWTPPDGGARLLSRMASIAPR